MASPSPPSTRSPLSLRPFILSLYSPPSTSSTLAPPQHARHLKRIHLATEILKATKICAGDVIILRRMPIVTPTTPTTMTTTTTTEEKEKEVEQGMKELKLLDDDSITPSEKYAVGIAWPSFTLSGSVIAVSPLLLANSGLTVGEIGSISTLATSGIELIDAERICLIYDLKGKAPVKDSFFEAFVKETIIDLKYLAIHHFVDVTYNGVARRLLVSSAKGVAPSPPSKSTCIYAVSRSTVLTFKSPIAALPRPRRSPTPATTSATGTKEGDVLPGYEAIGGMEAQIEQIRELIEWPLTRPELYSHFRLKPPRGILLYGPPGTGKTLLALSIARSTRSTLLTINGPSLSSAYHGETEARLRAVFAQAKASSPSVIVIDEIDALAPNREEGGEVERRVVATLLMLMDGLDDKEEGGGEDEEGQEGEEQQKGPTRVVVIAATNRPNAIDSALRRPGRFDREIEIGVPNAVSRLSILKVLLRRTPHALSEDELLSIAGRTHGFVGADIASLIHTAGLIAIRNSFQSHSSSRLHNPTVPSSSTPIITTHLKLSLTHFETALLSTRPSAMREVYLETPKVYYRDIGGQAIVKARLRESVEWPLLHPEAFKRLGVRPPRGILLYGPPGCSKTLIAKALATEGGLNFIAVKGPEVFNKYVGESEKAIRDLFRKARAAAPSIIFLDEIDAIAPARGMDDGGSGTGDRVLTSLLTEMDGIEELNGVIVLAATNRPEIIDTALMRPGRLDRILYVGPPDSEARSAIFRINFERMAVNDDVDVEILAQMTEGCSGAEIVSICQDAALGAMNEDINTPNIKQAHFLLAAQSVRRRITPEVIRSYERWRDRAGLRNA